MLDAAGYRTHDYDELGRPKRVERSIDSTPYTFTHTYNTAGLPASTTYPDSQTISWTYDTAGNLQTETGTITSAVYDAFGRPTSLSFANGVITTYSYSPTRGWLDNINTTKDSTVHQDLTYTRYADGMISGITSAKAMESWTYVYDDLNRLLTATNVDTPSLTQSFTYDDIGNMTYNSHIGTYTYPTPGTAQPHALTAAGSRSYVYDDVGRMTSRNGTVIQWNGDGKPQVDRKRRVHLRRNRGKAEEGFGVRRHALRGRRLRDRPGRHGDEVRPRRQAGGDELLHPPQRSSRLDPSGDGCDGSGSPKARPHAVRGSALCVGESSGIEGVDRRKGGGDRASLSQRPLL